MPFKSELIAFAPEIFLICLINLILVYGVVIITSSYLNYPIILSNVLFLGLLVLLFTEMLILNNPFEFFVGFDTLLIVDKFGLFAKNVSLLGVFVILLLSLKYSQFERINVFEFVVLILLAVFGLFLLISGYNLIVVYLAIELQSFCFYVLAALNRTSEFSAEAALKYFILGAFSSGLLLFGLSLIYGLTGTLSFEQIQQFLLYTKELTFLNKGIQVAIIFIFVGLFFKLGAAPFHLWLPDVYEGTPTSVTAFFAIAPKISILILLTRLNFDCFYEIFGLLQEFILLVALISIVLGTLGALMQRKLKRLMAYSSIGHVGYILLGLACYTTESIEASYLYLIFYMLMVGLSFIFFLGCYKNGTATRLNYLKDLSILTKSNSALSLCFVVGFFSMAGVPPLLGFFSKLFIFIAVINSEMFFLALLSILFSVAGCFYYIRVIKLLYFNNDYVWITLKRFDREKSIILAILMLMIIFAGVDPNFFLFGIHNVVILKFFVLV